VAEGAPGVPSDEPITYSKVAYCWRSPCRGKQFVGTSTVSQAKADKQASDGLLSHVRAKHQKRRRG
jgi:hypothetical protein